MTITKNKKLKKIVNSEKTNFIKNPKKVLAYGLASLAAASGAHAAQVTQSQTAITAYANNADIVTYNNAAASTVLAGDDTYASGTTTGSTDTVWTISNGHTLTITGILDTQSAGDMTVNLTGTDTQLALVAAWTEHGNDAGDQHHINLGTGTTVSMTTDVTRIEEYNGSTAGAGTMSVGGTTTFSEGVGATTALGTISIVTGKVATFSEAVKATTITAVGSATFAKAVTATNINLTASTMSVINAGAIAVAGTISDVSGTTALVVKNATATDAPSLTTFGGAVTVDTITVGSATLSGAAKFSLATVSNISVLGGDHDNEDSTVELVGAHTGNLTITTGTNTGLATATLSGGTAVKSLTGNVISGRANTGALVISGTATTITGTVGAEALRLLEVSVADAADTTFNDVIHSVTLDIDTNAIGEVTTLSKSGHVIGLNEGTAGALQIAGGELQLETTVLAGSTIFDLNESVGSTAGVLIGAAVNVIPPVNFTSGTITLIDGTFAATSDAEAVFLDAQDTLLTDFTVTTTGNIDTTITAADKSTAAIAAGVGVDTNAATALRQLVDAANAGDSTILADLQAAMVKNSAGTGQKAETKAILEQMSVQTDQTAGTVSASRAMTGTVQSIVANRMASLRSGDAYVAGVSAGSVMSANSGFIQAFGSEVTQKNTGVNGATTYGYESATSGVAIGFDGVTSTGATVGLSASASTTDVKGKGTGKAKTDIESYTVSLYADKATDFGYIEGSLTYGINDNSGQRFVKVNTIDRSYKSEYHSEQVSLKVGTGKPTEVIDGGFVTPFGSIAASVVSTNAYTETSATTSDVLRLKIAQDDVTSIVGSIGLKGHLVSEYGTPMISLALNNEFGDNTITSTNTYQGGGTAFKTSTAVEELSATLGVGYSFGNDATSVNIGYELEANDDDYNSHYGSVKIVSKF